MKRIDLASWNRQGHYGLFRSLDQPQYSTTVRLDCTGLKAAVHSANIPLALFVTHAISRVANSLPEFRQRLDEAGVVEHELIHPSMTVLGAGDLFAFCPLVYHDDIKRFASDAAPRIELAKLKPGVDVNHAEQDRIFISAIPWFSFTSFTHPIVSHRLDSVPRVAWGKIEDAGGLERVPVNVQVHHALVDGLHLAHFFDGLQAAFKDVKKDGL